MHGASIFNCFYYSSSFLTLGVSLCVCVCPFFSLCRLPTPIKVRNISFSVCNLWSSDNNNCFLHCLFRFLSLLILSGVQTTEIVPLKLFLVVSKFITLPLFCAQRTKHCSLFLFFTISFDYRVFLYCLSICSSRLSCRLSRNDIQT